MANREMQEVWPDVWAQTRHAAEGLIGQLKEKVGKELLSPDDLEALNTTLNHVRHVWDRAENIPIVEDGVSVIRSHFARRFHVDARKAPDVQFGQILVRMFARDYFANNNPEEPEFNSMTILMVHELRREKGKKQRGKTSQGTSDVVMAGDYLP